MILYIIFVLFVICWLLIHNIYEEYKDISINYKYDYYIDEYNMKNINYNKSCNNGWYNN